MSKAVNNALYYTIGALVRAFASFLLLPIFANILGSAQYGVLSLLQTFSSVLAILMTFGIERSLYRLYYDYKDEESKNKFLSTLFWSINATSLLIIVLSIACAGWLSNILGGVDAFTVIIPVIIYTFLQALINYSQIIMQVEQEGKSFLMISLLLLIAYNIVSLLFLFLYDKTYQSMVYGNLVANAVVLPFAYFKIRKRIRPQFDFKILNSTLHYSFPLLLMAIFAWALNMSDRLFLANFSTLESLGLYSMGSKIVSIMVLLDGAIFQAYGPFFFNLANTEEESTAKVKLKSSNDAITLIVGVIAFGIVLLSNLFFYTILNPEYRGSLIYVYILVLGAVLAQQTGLLNPMIYQNKKTREISIVTITCACISVGLNRLLIPLYGPIMAAWTNFTASCCMFVMTFILAKKNYFIPLNTKLLLCTMALITACYGMDVAIANVFIAFGAKLLLLVIVALLVLKFKIIDINTIKPVVEKLTAPLLGKINRINNGHQKVN